MNKRFLLLGILLNFLGIHSMHAQEKNISNEELLKRIEALEADKLEAQKKKDWGVSFYGFVRSDYIFDSRQNSYVRELNLNLYPLDEKLDANGKDINGAGASNFLAVTSRVGTKISGPKVWGAKVSAQIEADFFGNTEINKSSSGSGSIGLLRVRHAFATLDWEKTSLTLGQTWYPSFITDVFPGVSGFNTGILFNPFGWATQVKISQKLSPDLTFIASAYKDREFATSNASGGFSNSAALNSSVPNLHGQLRYKKGNITAGIAAEYQSLKPVIESAGLKSGHKVNSSNYLAYFKFENKDIIAKAYGVTGENLHHFVMIGGFAGYLEPNGQESYKASKTSAFWVDIASANPKVAPGVFFGYTQNNGVDQGYQNLYIRGTSGNRILDNVWRASARVDIKQNKFSITPEIEYTVAKWGDTNADAKAGNNLKTVGNFRGMVRVMYSF